jgi:Rrf2 family protein
VVEGGDAAAAQRELARLMDGYLTTQLLYVAAKLGVADVLADGPRTGAEVAAAVGADADRLTRMLRGLVVEEVLAEDDDGRFALTAVGERLRDGVPGSLRGQVIVRGETYWEAAGGLLRTATDGGTAFEHVHGAHFFEHLAAHPDDGLAFRASMAGRADREAADVVAAYDFAGVRRLVDVGGGAGVLLEAIVRATPGLHGLLVDLPEAVARASQRFAAAGLDGGVECRAGDFFAAVPAGRRRLPAVARHPRLGRRRRAPDPDALPRGDGPARAPAARRGTHARTRRRRPRGHPHGPPLPHAPWRARAHRGRVPRAARRRWPGAAARRPHGFADRPERPRGDARRARPLTARAGRCPTIGSQAMLSITTKSPYALRALAELGRSGDGPVPIGELARRREIPVQFLEQLFAAMRRAGILRSQRGVKGGYSFARPPHEITVLEIVELLDGPLGREAEGIFAEAATAARDVLAASTIGDIVDREARESGATMYYI